MKIEKSREWKTNQFEVAILVQREEPLDAVQIPVFFSFSFVFLISHSHQYLRSWYTFPRWVVWKSILQREEYQSQSTLQKHKMWSVRRKHFQKKEWWRIWRIWRSYQDPRQQQMNGDRLQALLRWYDWGLFSRPKMLRGLLHNCQDHQKEWPKQNKTKHIIMTLSHWEKSQFLVIDVRWLQEMDCVEQKRTYSKDWSITSIENLIRVNGSLFGINRALKYSNTFESDRPNVLVWMKCFSIIDDCSQVKNRQNATNTNWKDYIAFTIASNLHLNYKKRKTQCTMKNSEQSVLYWVDQLLVESQFEDKGLFSKTNDSKETYISTCDFAFEGLGFEVLWVLSFFPSSLRLQTLVQLFLSL